MLGVQDESLIAMAFYPLAKAITVSSWSLIGKMRSPSPDFLYTDYCFCQGCWGFSPFGSGIRWSGLGVIGAIVSSG